MQGSLRRQADYLKGYIHYTQECVHIEVLMLAETLTQLLRDDERIKRREDLETWHQSDRSWDRIKMLVKQMKDPDIESLELTFSSKLSIMKTRYTKS